MTIPSTSPLAHFKNQPVPGYPTFLPAQPYPIGALLPAEKFPQNAHPPKLFEPITIRGLTLPNRCWVAPMCQYSADNGHATDHHLVHIGSMVMRGWGNIMVEATAVVPEGRITAEDLGIWQDSQIAPMKRIVDYVHAHKGKIGIQLAHGGRKTSTLAPWVDRLARDDGWKGGIIADEECGGWPDNVYGPSNLSFDEGKYAKPIPMDSAYITDLKQKFLDAVERCKTIGFDFIEIHGAHGYLLHSFCSPVSNIRTDAYGGNLENRMRLPLEIAGIIRQNWDKPLFYRVSASDWLEFRAPEKAYPGKEEEYAWWGLEQTTILTQRLADIGVDLIDVSSGGIDPKQQIKLRPGYQVPFAAHIKKHVKNIIVGAVGLLTDAKQSNDIIEEGHADVCLFARELLRNIDFPLKAAEELGAAVSPAVQYERAWSRMVVPREHLKAPARHEGQAAVEGEENRPKRTENEK